MCERETLCLNCQLYMDMVTLEKVAACLETGLGEVAVDPAAAPQAKLTLDRMLEYAAR